MADKHVMNALTPKRGELLGHLADWRRELKQRGEELTQLEATIRLFAPQWVLDRVPIRRRQYFRCGEGQRRVLEALREAQEPIPEEGLVAVLRRAKGLEELAEARPGMRKTVLAVVRHLARKGIAPSVLLDDGARAWMRSGLRFRRQGARGVRCCLASSRTRPGVLGCGRSC